MGLGKSFSKLSVVLAIKWKSRSPLTWQIDKGKVFIERFFIFLLLFFWYFRLLLIDHQDSGREVAHNDEPENGMYDSNSLKVSHNFVKGQKRKNQNRTLRRNSNSQIQDPAFMKFALQKDSIENAGVAKENEHAENSHSDVRIRTTNVLQFVDHIDDSIDDLNHVDQH